MAGKRNPMNRCGGCGQAKRRSDITRAATYLIARDGYLKVGCSADPGTRIAHFESTRDPQITLPPGIDWTAPLHVLAVFHENVEHELHERWAAWHVRGEWFKPDAQMIPDLSLVARGGTGLTRVVGW